MREIELGGSGMVTLVDDEDYEKVIAAGPWFLEVRPRGFYAMRSYGKDPRRMHRVICPEIDRIDHIDRNGLNNQKSNLRRANAEQNNRNTEKKRDKYSASKYKGVSFDPQYRKPWSARISKDRRWIHYSRYETEIEAAIAYNEAAQKYLGEFAYLNDVIEPKRSA